MKCRKELISNAGPDMINLSEEDRTKYDAYLPFKKRSLIMAGGFPVLRPRLTRKGIGLGDAQARCNIVDNSLCTIGKRRGEYFRYEPVFHQRSRGAKDKSDQFWIGWYW